MPEARGPQHCCNQSLSNRDFTYATIRPRLNKEATDGTHSPRFVPSGPWVGGPPQDLNESVIFRKALRGMMWFDDWYASACANFLIKAEKHCLNFYPLQIILFPFT